MDNVSSNILDLLDPTMEKELFETLGIGDVSYYIFDQYNEFGGESVIIRQVLNEEPTIEDQIRPDDIDTVGGAGLPTRLQERLNALQWMEKASDFAVGGGILSPEKLNELVHQQAQRCSNRNDSDFLKSDQAAGTNGGRLACAWAVNRVTKLALNSPIGGGLSTADMYKVLKDNHIINDNPLPGNIVISPTQTIGKRRNIGHVGIIGSVDNQDPGSTLIFSNSSRRARFEQNFTFDSWRNYYEGKGLKVRVFQLDASAFPAAGV